MLNKSWLPLLLAASGAQMATAATVMAHFMVANSYAYNQAQWKTDMAAASQMGIDGFALNWTPPDCTSPSLDWTVSRIDDAYKAAAQVGFKLMMSFDMSYTECNIYWNQTFMTTMITKYAASSASLRWDTKTVKNTIVVSTYGGDSVSEYGDEFFAGLKAGLTGSNTISLVPALTSYSTAAQTNPSGEATKLVSDYKSIDGFLNWQAWPLDGNNLTTTVDADFQSALKTAGRTGPYIMAISPWQFKDLDDGNKEDAWVAYSDTLFPQRLHALATKEIQPDIIELLTWNDFCESHYLRDLPSMSSSATDFMTFADGMNNYVQNVNHGPWRIIAKYYIAWWKTGKAPPITMDQVVYWYRTHPKAAVCSGGVNPGIRNSQYPVDAVFAWALVKSKATISVTVGGSVNTFTADASGPVTNMVPFPASLPSTGVTPSVSIVRNGKSVFSSTGTQAITSSCTWENFNPSVNLAGSGVNTGKLTGMYTFVA